MGFSIWKLVSSVVMFFPQLTYHMVGKFV
ncbi:hypothetical protein CO2235_MP10299 [Cupriavidus oxalaticus]|uniref:Uncharacterized protein n=1 Tax=Cupriavidus oxalaticus TaxID=96344 RepID=A0A375GCS6_9BURK|nr:hypothetical protein CO2235_MP10299 [Cupriavidus oxalaticus]